MNLTIADTFNKELPADPIRENTRRQVMEAGFSFVYPRKPSNPQLLHVSDEMLEAIGLDQSTAKSKEFLEVFSGGKVLEGTDPYSMCYGGHQFGHWAGQLGDGRAINLAEVIHAGKRWALQLKGAGETPYSRSADGLAVLRSSIREHLCSEAMHHLGVPTTRSLSLMLTGDKVLRDVMYDGNAAFEKGAVVCRVAPSFLRFGNFQIFAARRDNHNLKLLADYTIRHFYPQIQSTGKAQYIDLFRLVAEATLEMIIHWQRVGFVHGVMNTDNMSMLGLTIDYGPYGWLEDYDPDWTPNTTDKDGRRYRFGHQPQVALWNLLQLANALYPLVEESKPFEEILTGYKTNYPDKYYRMMAQKLGLTATSKKYLPLISELERILQLTETDMTIFFRDLADMDGQQKIETREDVLAIIGNALYKPEELEKVVLTSWLDWLQSYQSILKSEPISAEEKIKSMQAVNPRYVLRNYMAQLAIDAADRGEYDLIEELYRMLKNPYTVQPKYDHWYTRRPDWARHKIGCSMLSCSS